MQLPHFPVIFVFVKLQQGLQTVATVCSVLDYELHKPGGWFPRGLSHLLAMLSSQFLKPRQLTQPYKTW